jgi:hypothetical protein
MPEFQPQWPRTLPTPVGGGKLSSVGGVAGGVGETAPGASAIEKFADNARNMWSG